MKLEIVKNAKRNIIFGIINKIILMLSPFITRTIVLYTLSTEYLGLDSLFASILQVLSLSELGFSSAVVCNMYKPVADGDTKTVNALLKFYQKAYRTIGFFLLGFGLLLIPFLPNFIKGSYPDEINLTTLYLLFLANTAVSYFMYAYRSSLIVVFQRDDLNSKINSLITILLFIARVIVLLATKNYYLYTLLMPFFTIINNLWIAYITQKEFPGYKPDGHLNPDLKQKIKKIVAGTFIQKACAITRNSLDSIFISAFLGLTLTGIYNNYYCISAAITSFMGIFVSSIAGGVGNHVATKNSDENFEELQKMDFLYLWFGGWCTICLLCLYQPFMTIWMGPENLLDNSTVLLLCIYFYLLKLGDIRSLYASAKGIWWEHKWRSITETVLNILLNYFFGKYYGINGIVLATILSLFFCNTIWSTQITFNIFWGKDKFTIFLKEQIKYSFITILIAYFCFELCYLNFTENAYISLLYKFMLCLIFPNLMFFIIYRKHSVFKQSIRYLQIRKKGATK